MTHTSESILRIGIIGAGARGTGSYAAYLPECEPKAELVAIAEPDAENARLCLDAVAGRQKAVPNVYADWQDMLASEPGFDGMIIATPNHLHSGPACDCMRHGIRAIMLEKPLASRPGDCHDIVRLAGQTGARVQLGFVLRSAPFYRQVRRLLQQEAIGRVMSIQADELVSFFVTSLMLRSPWRRHRATAGGALLEKCCHDIDLMNWFAGARPARVNSFGSRMLFGGNPLLPDRCGECAADNRCNYREVPVASEDVANQAHGHRLRDADRCIYNTGTDSVDHQGVQVLYENGVVANFLMNFNCSGPRSERNLHIVGSRGRIWGNLIENVVYSHDNDTGQTRKHSCESDGSGHGGGDRRHALSFVACVADPDAHPVADAYDGYLSAMTCFAADQSMAEARQVGLHYAADDLIEIV